MGKEINVNSRETQDRLIKEFKETHCSSHLCPKEASCWQAHCNPSRCETWASCTIKVPPQCHAYDVFMSRNVPK